MTWFSEASALLQLRRQQTWSEPGPSQVLKVVSELIPPALLVSGSSHTDDISNTLDTVPLSVCAGLNYTIHVEASPNPVPPKGETLRYKQGSDWSVPNHLYF